jgi:hypothetical protein
MNYLGYGHVRPTRFPGEDRGSLLAVTENSIPNNVEQSCHFLPILGVRLKMICRLPSIGDFRQPFPSSSDGFRHMGPSLLDIRGRLPNAVPANEAGER